MMRLSTPTRTSVRLLHRPACALALWAVVLGSAPSASAMDCSEEEEAGLCLDASTFQWCEDGELKSAKCPDGQICVSDNPWYDGAGCLSTDNTACGDIPPEGECTTANGVVWCEEGEPQVYACGEDSVCGWDESTGEYDCLPRANAGPPPEISEDATAFGEPDSSSDEDTSRATVFDDIGPQADSQSLAAEDDVDASEGSAPAPDVTPTDPTASPAPDDAETPDNAELRENATADATVVPTVTRTGSNDGHQKRQTQGAEGCGGGPAPQGWVPLLLSLAMVAMRRRERSSANA